MAKIEMTNMVMIQDKQTGKVLVQDRVKSWMGLSFPGGHVEDNESIVDSAKFVPRMYHTRQSKKKQGWTFAI